KANAPRYSDENRIDAWARRREERGAEHDARTLRTRHGYFDARPIPAADARALTDRALRASRRVSGVQNRGRADGLQACRIRSARSFFLSRLRSSRIRHQVTRSFNDNQ